MTLFTFCLIDRYDCSSADINPIGGISKKDLKSFIHYFMEKYNVEPLREIAGAPPTAELEPLNEGLRSREKYFRVYKKLFLNL